MQKLLTSRRHEEDTLGEAAPSKALVEDGKAQQQLGTCTASPAHAAAAQTWAGLSPSPRGPESERRRGPEGTARKNVLRNDGEPQFPQTPPTFLPLPV